MGHQQKLLYISGLMIVGAAILVGIQKFDTSYQEANINLITLDLMAIATNAQSYYFTPGCLNGGGGSFSRLSPTQIGERNLCFDAENINGTFKIIEGNANFLIIQGIGKIDYDGDGKNLTIEMEVFPDTVQTEVVNY
jgi:hypothetical protein